MSDDDGVMIGLETHVQVDTETKLFCGCSTEPVEEPNTNVCEICLGFPGSKPRTNDAVIDAGIQAGLAVDCSIDDTLTFSRKTYFYPDMAKNFQITQYESPLASDGVLAVDGVDVRIRRIHVEEDPAKIQHVGGSMDEARYTKVDYNRAGTPLLEVVTEPDLRDAEHARAFLNKLIRIMEYLGIYDRQRMTLRSDANVSTDGGERVEVKNISGTQGVEKALKHEIQRQRTVRKRGREVERETRMWDGDEGITRSLRSKETEEDYGYIYEPDLVRLPITPERVEQAEATLPELPGEKRSRFLREYGIEEELAASLITDPALADAFEAAVDAVGADLAASWFSGPIKKTLNYHEVQYAQIHSQETQNAVIHVLERLKEGDISDSVAEDLIRDIVNDQCVKEEVGENRTIEKTLSETLTLSESLDTKIEEEGLEKAGGDELEAWVDAAIDEHPEAVEDYAGGDEQAINFLVGQVMQKSGGSADPKETRELLAERLD